MLLDEGWGACIFPRAVLELRPPWQKLGTAGYSALINAVMTSSHGVWRPRYHGKLFHLQSMVRYRQLMMRLQQPLNLHHLLLSKMMAPMMGR